MNKKEITDYFENVAYFRDYRFRSSKFYKKGSLGLLNPSHSDLRTAVADFHNNKQGTIIVYLSEKRMNPPKVKRIKQVFSSSQEVFHLWAAQSQSEARQAGSRTRSFFEGKSCYSYGRHYEVARLVKINGVQCALINRDGYSSTTGKHISEASNAVSHMPQINVSSAFDWKRGLVSMQDDLIDSLFNNLNRIGVWKGLKAFDKYERESFEKFNKLCKIVGMPQLQLFPNKETVKVIDQYIKFRLNRATELAAYKLTPEYLEKQTKAQLAEAERDARKQAERLVLQRIEAEKRAISDPLEVEAWKRGGPFTNAVRSLHPQLIRIVGNEVQTSNNATVPLSDACRALMHIENRKLKQGDKIGNFEFTSLKGDIVKIGCHEISLEQAKNVLYTTMKRNVG